MEGKLTLCLSKSFSKSRPCSYASRYNLQPGDRLIEPIFQTGIAKHHSIYLGADEQGLEWIAENHKFHGVRLVKANEFFRGGQTYEIKRFNGSRFDRLRSVSRALSVVGKPYELINYNCEHFASYVQTGNAASSQVENAFLLLITAAIVGAIAND